MNVPELKGTYIPSMFVNHMGSDLMGSSEPSIWLCATSLQSFPSSQMGKIDAETSVHCALYICSSILRLANGASPPRIRFSPTLLHTCCLHTVYPGRRSDGLSSSSGRSHGDAIDGSHRRRSRRNEASGSSVPPMRLSLKSLHTVAVASRFGRAGALTTDDGGRVHKLQLQEHRKHLQAAVDGVAWHASAHQPRRRLYGNAVARQGWRRLACQCNACPIHLGDAALARQHRQPARQRADHFGEVAKRSAWHRNTAFCRGAWTISRAAPAPRPAVARAHRDRIHTCRPQHHAWRANTRRCMCQDLWASEWSEPMCPPHLWDWAWVPQPAARSPQSPRAESRRRR